jgi:hypothetical protein
LICLENESKNRARPDKNTTEGAERVRAGIAKIGETARIIEAVGKVREIVDMVNDLAKGKLGTVSISHFRCVGIDAKSTVQNRTVVQRYPQPGGADSGQTVSRVCFPKMKRRYLIVFCISNSIPFGRES